MGEEHFSERPFQFFTDHVEPAIAEATREGRRREFEAFAGFRGEVPDPQDERTFERSKLEWREPDPWYRELLRLRRETPGEIEVEVEGEGETLHLRRGRVELVADFARKTAELRT
jgi:maltooligosyltrehalose trehalohydrolase